MVYVGSLVDASYIKGLLEEAEIKVFLQDEIIGTAIPWVDNAPAGVKVVVAKEDAERAKSIVQDSLDQNKQK